MKHKTEIYSCQIISINQKQIHVLIGCTKKKYLLHSGYHCVKYSAWTGIKETHYWDWAGNADVSPVFSWSNGMVFDLSTFDTWCSLSSSNLSTVCKNIPDIIYKNPTHVQKTFQTFLRIRHLWLDYDYRDFNATSWR